MARQILSKRRIEILGIAELAENIKEIVKRVDASDAIKRVYMEAAEPLLFMARMLAPVGPTRKYKGQIRHGGTLKNAIFRNYGDKNKNDVLVGVRYNAAKGGAPHAHWLEFGNSRRTKAQPYMRPAIAITRPTVGKIMQEGLLKLIQQPPTKSRRFI